MKISTIAAIAWIATAVTIIIGIYLTKNADCLWGFFFPTYISFYSRKMEEN